MSLKPIKAHVVSLSKKLYPHCSRKQVNSVFVISDDF